jgi:hypothetical protein
LSDPLPVDLVALGDIEMSERAAIATALIVLDQSVAQCPFGGFLE